MSLDVDGDRNTTYNQSIRTCHTQKPCYCQLPTTTTHQGLKLNYLVISVTACCTSEDWGGLATS